MGMMASFREIAPWRVAVYAVCVAGVFALVIWDLVDESAQYTTAAVIVLLMVAIVVRPGGIRGPRRRR